MEAGFTNIMFVELTQLIKNSLLFGYVLEYPSVYNNCQQHFDISLYTSKLLYQMQLENIFHFVALSSQLPSWQTNHE